MKKSIIISSVIAALAALTVFGLKTQTSEYVKQVQQRFPEIDPKILEKAYKHMLRDAWSGNISADIADADDSVMDELFMNDYVRPLL